MSGAPKKKVLFTSHTANFQKFNRPFMRWFAEQGWVVHYASMGEEKVQDCDKHFTVPFTRSPFRLSNITAYRQLKKIIDRENYDIIHTHTPMGSVVTRLAARKARKRGTRVIYTAHGFHFFKGAPLLNWLFYFPMEWLMSFVTDDLVTINKEDYEASKKRLHARHNHYLKGGVGIDLLRFHPVSEEKKQELRQTHGYASDDFILICVAEFTKNKSQAFLIRAMPRILETIPKAKLVLVGKGDEQEACRELIERLGLGDRVVMLGYRTDIDELYQLSDILVSASQREGLALNPLEAAATGLVGHVSDNRGHREGVEGFGERSGWSLYPPGDQDAYVSGVVHLAHTLTGESAHSEGLADLSIYTVSHALINMRAIYRFERVSQE